MGRQRNINNDRTLRIISSPDEIPPIIQEEMADAGPLPDAAVILSSSALIHQLRASSGGLSGVTFLSPLEIASLVLLANGEHTEILTDRYLAPMVEALISSPLLQNQLSYFKIDQLRTGAGYAEALASTISELSLAALNPEELNRGAQRAAKVHGPTSARIKDIAAIWKALASQASFHGYRTSSQLLTIASQKLSTNPKLYPLRGQTIAFIDEQTSNILIEFFAAIPRLTVVYFQAYPLRRKLQDRIERVKKELNIPQETEGRRTASVASFPPGPPKKEIDILKQRLFHPIEEYSDPRFASPGPDGTVHLEEHSGIEEEIQSAVEWISRQILEHKVPLERIAVLLPEIDPYAYMLAERLNSLPFDKEPPVYVASGIPATTHADGSRLAALIDVLEAHLSADSLSRFVPYLRLSGRENDDQHHLTFAESLELIYSCGTLGGLAGRPESAREWTGAMARRENALKFAVDDQKLKAAEDPEESLHARGFKDNERLRDNIQALRPAVAELTKLHDILLRGEALDSLWDAVRRFASDWVLLPPSASRVLPLLESKIEPLLSLSKAKPDSNPEERFRMTGLPALRIIRKTLDGVRIPIGRFGEPRIYIGTLEGAVGLTFEVARIMGLCEGAYPSRPAVDPILPDVDRGYLEPGDVEENQIIPRRDDRPLHQLCSFYRFIQGVRSRLLLSFARQSVDGTIKEPSSVYLEVATALRRPISGKPASSIPSLKDLRLGYFIPAREAESGPPTLGKFSVYEKVAGRSTPTRASIPSSWRTPPGASTDMERMGELILFDRSGIAGPQDGVLSPEWPLPRLPGLQSQSPLSASRIKRFLECPYWFLLQDILHWEEPPSAPLTREIDQMAYGSLLHRLAEAFFNRHGKDFTARQRSLTEWKKTAAAMIDREFAHFLEEYPLLSGRVRDQQRKRLIRDFLRLLEYEWKERDGLKFRAVEFSYGFLEPLRLDLDGRPFFVRGFIDRLDDHHGRILIRDIKSGKARPREKKDLPPSPVLDAQLAVYALVMNAHSQKDPGHWPGVGGVAYFYPDPRAAAERAFEKDLDELLESGSRWLSTLADMIEGRAFPRTVDKDDCTYCPFVPICGDQAGGSAYKKLRTVGGRVQDFLALKRPEEEKDEELES